MYLHPDKGQFLIIHDPKNTFEDEMHDGLQTRLIFFPLKYNYLGIP